MLLQIGSWGLTWFVAGFSAAAGVATLIAIVQAGFYVCEQIWPAEPEGDKPCRFCLQDETERRPIVVSISGVPPKDRVRR
jgi:hypothetical protein